MEISNSAEKSILLQIPIRIQSAYTDAFARLRMGALINILVEAAIQSADSLGFGYSGLRKNQLFWVLSRLSIEIHHTIRWYDSIWVETWPKDIDGLHYLRDFIIRNEAGEELIKATSAWLAIDVDSKRIRTLEGELLESLHRRSDLHALAYTPEKLTSVKLGESFPQKAGYHDLDLNRHVTSSRYIDWMMESFPMDFHQQQYPEYLAVNFMKETMYGNELSIRRTESEHGLFQFEADNLSRVTQSFRGKIRFKTSN